MIYKWKSLPEQPLLLIFICLLLSCTATGQTLLNSKGTRLAIDTSKWTVNGSNIYTKNTGNTGIGISLPLYKLDINAASNPLRLAGLQSGASTDSVLTVQNGVVRYASINKLITDTSIYRYDGSLTGNRILTFNGNTFTFATGGNALNITGLTSGTITDSLLTINPSTGRVSRLAISQLSKTDSTTASNGLALTGKDVRMGGNLTQATTITSNSNALTFATGGTALNITGLTSGTLTDSLVTVNPSTGKINRLAMSQLNKSDSTTASNGLALTSKDVRLGGNLTQATTITNNSNAFTFATGGTALNITGLTSGTLTDSIVSVNPSTGKLNRLAISQLSKADSTTASNGLALMSKDVKLGGNLTQATIITNNSNTLTFATGGTALNITGLTSGALTDSLVTVNPATGRINNIAISQLNKVDSTTASNGLGLTGKDVRLGGNLTQATTITNNSNALTFATGGSALNITGLTGGALTDSLVTVNPSTGKINRLAVSQLSKADSTTASNGLGLTGKDVRLGGNLTQATTITNNSNALTFATGGTALNITGLTSGALTDSLVTVNPATGKISRLSVSQLSKTDSTTASNGLGLTGKDVRLGGNLTQATTITNNSNALTFATGGSALNISGLTSGASTDSILVINPTTNKVNRISPASLINTSNLTFTGSKINTIQNIDTASTPSFFNIKLTDLGTGGAGDAGIVINDPTGLLGTQTGTGLLTDDGAGNITYTDAGNFLTNAVESFSGGTTGLTPNTASDGNVILGGVLNPANGGTGTNYVPANGVILLGNGTTYSALTPGIGGTVLKGNGASNSPTWDTLRLTSDVKGILPLKNGGTGSASFTNGSVVFSDGTKLTEDNPSFFWDNTNNRLGIGTTTPAQALDVTGNMHFTGTLIPGNSTPTSGYLLKSTGASSPPVWVDPGSITVGGSVVGNGPWDNAYTGASATDTATNIAYNFKVGIQNGGGVPTAKLAVGTTSNTNSFGGNVQISSSASNISSAAFNGFAQIYPYSVTDSAYLLLPSSGFTGTNGKLMNKSTASKVELQNFSSSNAGVTQTPVSAVTLGGTTVSNGTAAFTINNTTQLLTNSDSTQVIGKLRINNDFRPNGNPGTAGQVLVSAGSGAPPVWNSTTTPDATASTKGALQLTNDLSGTAAAPKVTGIQGVDVSATAPITGQALVYNGSNWVPTAIPALPTIVKTSTTQATSSTTAVTVNTLTFNTVAGKSYRVKLWLVFNSSATSNGIKLAPLAVSGANYWYTTTVHTSTTATTTVSYFNTATLLSSTAVRGTTGNVAVIDMTVEATSAGTVAFQFGSEGGSPASITIQPNSWLEYEIIK